jgi:hypothetical protein
MTYVLVKFCAINILYSSDGGMESELQTYGFKNGLVEKSNDAKIRIHSKVQC